MLIQPTLTDQHLTSKLVYTTLDVRVKL